VSSCDLLAAARDRARGRKPVGLSHSGIEGGLEKGGRGELLEKQSDRRKVAVAYIIGRGPKSGRLPVKGEVRGGEVLECGSRQDLENSKDHARRDEVFKSRIRIKGTQGWRNCVQKNI